MNDTPFEELLRRARAGDADARGELYARYEPMVRRRARSRMSGSLRRRLDTADVVHEVFTDTFAKLEDLDDRGEPAFRSLLLMRVEGEVIDAHRRAHDAGGGRREVTSVEGVAEPGGAPGPGPATQAEAADDRSVLIDLLDSLPPTDAAVLRLRTSESLPFDEIARRIGLPSADAARMRYARAVVELRGRWSGGR